VIVYHAIGRVPRNARHWNGFIRPERFEAQMAYLAKHRRVVTLGELLDSRGGPGPPRVALTFDDGYRNVLEHAVPVLRNAGFAATFFVPTKWIGSRCGWGGEGDVGLPIIDAGELRTLEGLGFAIESHGHAHIDYARSEPAAVEADVRASVETLGELLGHAPRYLAYPYGRVTEAAATEAVRCGLRAGFVLDRRQDVSGAFALERVPIVPADARPLYALKTAGRYSGWRHSAPVRGVYRAVRPIVRNRWLWP
jgi:peptidoglycan/xylan/chitin deacetylase (PgdA/CDA1 family)